MTVNDVYKIVLYAASKNLQQGYISPDDFNLVINQAQTSFQDYLLGEFQQYRPFQPVSRVGYSNNETTRQRLQPLIYWYTLNVDTIGFAPYPGDYQQTDAMLSIYGNNRIRFSQQDKLFSLYNSKIDPYQTNPFYLIENKGFRFYPNDINQTRLSYVRTAPKIVWAYTLDVNGVPVYDPVNSVNPVWYDVDILEIIARALRIIGVNLQSNVISQYANEIKTQGQ